MCRTELRAEVEPERVRLPSLLAASLSPGKQKCWPPLQWDSEWLPGEQGGVLCEGTARLAERFLLARAGEGGGKQREGERAAGRGGEDDGGGPRDITTCNKHFNLAYILGNDYS